LRAELNLELASGFTSQVFSILGQGAGVGVGATASEVATIPPPLLFPSAPQLARNAHDARHQIKLRRLSPTGQRRRIGCGAARHLLKTEENEHVEVHEVSGFVSDTVQGAMMEAYALSRGTKCQQHLFSDSLNPPEGLAVPVETFEAATRAPMRAQRWAAFAEQSKMTITRESLKTKTPAQLAALFNDLTISLGATKSPASRASLLSQRAVVTAERATRAP
jgi:hypothetical protein